MARTQAAFVLGLLALSTVSAIYPDDHWDFAKELTTDNFDEFVQSEVDSGRTLFAPAWNQVVKDFASNPGVSFGDVNLKEQQIRGDHSPGKGGWPTIKYFNKETGIAGAHYEKKTDDAMCDELGPKGEDYMTQYVEEAAKTSSCSLEGVGCSEKQVAYIEKMKAKTDEDRAKQLARLSGMKDSDMTPELKDWKNQRIKILSMFNDGGDAGDADKPKEDLR